MNLNSFFINQLSGNDSILGVGQKKINSGSFMFSDIIKICGEETQLNTQQNIPAETDISNELFASTDNVLNVSPADFKAFIELVSNLVSQSSNTNPTTTVHKIDEAEITKIQFVLPEDELVALINEISLKGESINPNMVLKDTAEDFSKPVSITFKNGANKLSIAFNQLKVDEDYNQKVITDEFQFVDKIIANEGLLPSLLNKDKLDTAPVLDQVKIKVAETTEDEDKELTENVSNPDYYKAEIIKIIVPFSAQVPQLLENQLSSESSRTSEWKPVDEAATISNSAIVEAGESTYSGLHTFENLTRHVDSLTPGLEEYSVRLIGARLPGDNKEQSFFTDTNNSSESKNNINLLSDQEKSATLENNVSGTKTIIPDKLQSAKNESNNNFTLEYITTNFEKDLYAKTVPTENSLADDLAANQKVENNNPIYSGGEPDQKLIDGNIFSSKPVMDEQINLSVGKPDASVKSSANISQPDYIEAADNENINVSIETLLADLTEEEKSVFKTAIRSGELKKIIFEHTKTVEASHPKSIDLADKSSVSDEQNIQTEKNVSEPAVQKFTGSESIITNGESTDSNFENYVRPQISEPANSKAAEFLKQSDAKNLNAVRVSAKQDDAVQNSKSTNTSDNELSILEKVNEPELKNQFEKEEKPIQTVKSDNSIKTNYTSETKINISSVPLNSDAEKVEEVEKKTNPSVVIKSGAKVIVKNEQKNVLIDESKIVSERVAKEQTNAEEIENTKPILEPEVKEQSVTVNKFNTEKPLIKLEAQPELKSEIKADASEKILTGDKAILKNKTTIEKEVDIKSGESKLTQDQSVLTQSDEQVSAKKNIGKVNTENDIKLEQNDPVTIKEKLVSEIESKPKQFPADENSDSAKKLHVQKPIAESVKTEDKNVYAKSESGETSTKANKDDVKTVQASDVEINDQIVTRKNVSTNVNEKIEIADITTASASQSKTAGFNKAAESAATKTYANPVLEIEAKGVEQKNDQTVISNSVAEKDSEEVKQNNSNEIKTATKETADSPRQNIKEKSITAENEIEIKNSAPAEKIIQPKPEEVTVVNNQSVKANVKDQDNKASAEPTDIKIDSNSDSKTQKQVVHSSQTDQREEKNSTSRQNSNETFKNTLSHAANGVNDFDMEKVKPVADQKAVHETFKMVKQSEIIPEFSKVIQQGEKQTLTLQLTPENLGKVRMIVDLIDNQVTTRIEVENENVKQYIQSNIEQLKQNLQSNGIQLSNVNISLADYEQKSAKNSVSKKKNNQRDLKETKIEDEPIKIARKQMGYNTYEYLA